MKILFYILYGFFGLLGAYFVLSSLAGRMSLGDASQLSAKAVLVIAAFAGGGALYWAYQLGELQGRWLPGIGAVLLAVVAFQLVIVIGRIALG
ncbi:MAG TPA: hypothetical protein VGK29_05215 [Paludibaculum sp.]